METERKEFETAMWAYYLDLKAKGWSAPEEGDPTPEALFWREESGKYGVLSVEAAWNGWQMARKSVVPASGALERAHELGFLRCAGWAQRDDLFSDVTSQAYRKDRSHDLATITTPPQAATGVNPELLRGWQRYEKARKLNPRHRAWDRLWRNIAGEHFDDMIDALPDAETPLPQAAPVAQLSEPPEGWVLVPITPTADMLASLDGEDDDKYLARGRGIRAWKLMLAAAPTTPKD